MKPVVDPPPPAGMRPQDPAKLRRAVYIGVRTVHRQAQDMMRTCGIEGTNAKQVLAGEDLRLLREQVRLAQQALFVIDQYLDKLGE